MWRTVATGGILPTIHLHNLVIDSMVRFDLQAGVTLDACTFTSWTILDLQPDSHKSNSEYGIVGPKLETTLNNCIFSMKLYVNLKFRAFYEVLLTRNEFQAVELRVGEKTRTYTQNTTLELMVKDSILKAEFSVKSENIQASATAGFTGITSFGSFKVTAMESNNIRVSFKSCQFSRSHMVLLWISFVSVQNTVFSGLDGIRIVGKNLCCTRSKFVRSALYNSPLKMTQSHLQITKTNFDGTSLFWKKYKKARLAILNSKFRMSSSGVALQFSQQKYRLVNTEVSCPLKINVQSRNSEPIMYILSCISNCRTDEYKVESDAMASVTLFQTQSDPLTSVFLDQIAASPSCVKCPLETLCGASSMVAIPNYWGFREHNGVVRMLRCVDQYCCQNSEDCTDIESCNANRVGILCGLCADGMTESLFSPQCFHLHECKTPYFVLLYFLCVILYALFLATYRDAKKLLQEKLGDTLKAIKVKVVLATKCRSRSMTVSEVCTDTKEEKMCSLDTGLHSQNSRSLTLSSQRSVSLPCVTDKMGWPQVPKHPRCKSDEYFGDRTEDTPDVSKETCDDKESDDDADSGMKYMQILLYYVQDASLFKIHIPHINTGETEDNFLVKFLRFSPEILTLYYEASTLCLAVETTPTRKVLLSILFGPCIVLFLFLTYLVVCKMLSFCFSAELVSNMKARLVQAYLLTILLAFQSIAKSTFSLIQCVKVHDSEVLYIQGDTVCYTWWQKGLEIYLYSSVVPVLLVLSIGPCLLEKRTISVQFLLLSCLMPLPAVCFFIWRQIRQATLTKTPTTNTKEENVDHEHSGSEEMVFYVLLRHYKPLKILSVSVTWIGPQMFMRMMLVACHTYITEPLPRLLAMTALVICKGISTFLLKPYKDRRANITANISYIASACIAITNIVKASLVTSGYKPTSVAMEITLQYIEVSEKVILGWIPVVAIATWALYSLGTHAHAKFKKKWMTNGH